MPKPVELFADAGFGESVDSGYILAVHPEEGWLPDGMPAAGRRTFVLKLNGGKAEFVETVPAPLVRVWCSANGTAYCGPVQGNYLYTFSGGKWEKATISEKDEQIRFIWGFSGATPAEDTVYVCVRDALIVKQKAAWKRITAPKGSRQLTHVHGLNPQEVYVCAGGKFLLWDGKKIQSVGGPEENDPTAVWVLSETEMMAGANLLFRWTEDSGWEIVETPLRSYSTFLEMGKVLYSAIAGIGVAKFKNGLPELVTEKFDCVHLDPLGNGIVAVAWQSSSYLFDGKAWKKLTLPLCEKGLLPKK